jgi:hypothetical protein
MNDFPIMPDSVHHSSFKQLSHRPNTITEKRLVIFFENVVDFKVLLMVKKVTSDS